MKTRIYILVLLLAAAVAHAQTSNLTSLLQQGLLDEASGHDLNAAIADYQSLSTQFDKDRKITATAVYRLGECYRMLGRTNEAAAQYERIVREFSDQETLTTYSAPRKLDRWFRW
jgi:TolA-binding protein